MELGYAVPLEADLIMRKMLNMIRSLLVWATILTAGIIGTVGCSQEPKTYPVRGLVRFSDGKPLQHGTIEFVVKNHDNPPTARGEIGPDGSFILGTYALDDGALAGVHRAVVISDYDIGNGRERPGMFEKSRLHAKYRDFATSGLEFTVHPQANEIIIEVDVAPDPEAE